MNAFYPMVLRIENVIITHEESTTYANEGRAVFYMEGGKKVLAQRQRAVTYDFWVCLSMTWIYGVQ